VKPHGEISSCVLMCPHVFSWLSSCVFMLSHGYPHVLSWLSSSSCCLIVILMCLHVVSWLSSSSCVLMVILMCLHVVSWLSSCVVMVVLVFMCSHGYPHVSSCCLMVILMCSHGCPRLHVVSWLSSSSCCLMVILMCPLVSSWLSRNLISFLYDDVLQASSSVFTCFSILWRNVPTKTNKTFKDFTASGHSEPRRPDTKKPPVGSRGTQRLRGGVPVSNRRLASYSRDSSVTRSERENSVLRD